MLKVGIFGVGHLGCIHIQQWKEIPGVELIGFYDPNDERAASVATALQLRRYADYNALIQDAHVLDIVAITTAHYEIAKACLLQSKHIFIEKPLANTMAEAKDLVQLMAEANVKCQIGHVERYNPALTALKGQILQPMFIETHRLAQFNPRGADVAVILDLMIHDIDVVLHLVNSPVRRISASGVNIVSNTADIANARIEFDNGCVANLTASRISLKKMRKMRIFQRDAYIGIDFLNKKTEIIRMKQAHETQSLLDFPIDLGEGKKKIISIEYPPIKEANAIREELADFVYSILTNKPVTVPIHAGFNAMEVAHKILEKLETQSKISSDWVQNKNENNTNE